MLAQLFSDGAISQLLTYRRKNLRLEFKRRKKLVNTGPAGHAQVPRHAQGSTMTDMSVSKDAQQNHFSKNKGTVLPLPKVRLNYREHPQQTLIFLRGHQ